MYLYDKLAIPQYCIYYLNYECKCNIMKCINNESTVEMRDQIILHKRDKVN